MPPQLDTLIRTFRASQDRGVALLRDRLGVLPSASNREWVFSSGSSGLDEVKEINGVHLDTHGYGIELRTGDFVIDFDWGDNGEPDGFDGWRLYLHSLEQELGFACTHEDCIRWLEQAFQDGELSRDSHLYYDPRFRAVNN